MGKIMKKLKKELYITTILYGILLWNEYTTFTFNSDKWMNIVLCNLIVFFVLYKIISVIININVPNQPQIIGYIEYSIPIMIILGAEILLFTLNGNDFLVGDIKFIHDNAIQFHPSAYQFNYFTGYIYIISYILFPTQLAPLILKFFLESFLAGYIVYRGKRITSSKFIYSAYFLVYLLPETLLTHRLHFYVILYLFLVSKCIFDYYEGKEYSIKEIINILMGFSVLSVWRVEGIYFIVIAPLIVCCINQMVTIKKYIQLLIGIILITILVSVPQKIELSTTSEYYNTRLSHWYNYVVVNMFRLGLDTDAYTDEIEIIDKVISVDAINRINEELGDHNYEDEYIAWKEGYIGIRQYSMEDYEAYSKAVISLIINEPLLFLKSQWGAWNYTNKLSISWNIDKRNLMSVITSMISSLYNSRCNLYLPFMITLFVIGRNVLTKRWLELIFSIGIVINWGIVFLLCPAAYIKYYIAVWAGSYFLLIMQLLLKNNDKNLNWKKLISDLRSDLNIYILFFILLICEASDRNGLYRYIYINLCILLCIWFEKAIDKFSARISAAFNQISIALIVFEMIEVANCNSLTNMETEYVLANVIVIFVLTSIIDFFILTNIKKVFIAMYFLFCMAVYFVYQFRKVPLTIRNLSQAGTALNVVNNYSFNFSNNIYVLIICTLILFLLCKGIQNTRREKTKIFEQCLLTGMGIFVIYEVVFGKITSISNFSNISFDIQQNYTSYGYTLCTIKSLKTRAFIKPDNYSMETIQKIYNEIDCESVKNLGEKWPNVILIVNESYFDLRQVAYYTTDIEVTPFWDGLENVIRGYAVNPNDTTADSEYEILTENATHLVFGTTQFIQQNLNQVNSIVRNYDQLGYDTYGMHTEYGKNYNRVEAYPALGFKDVEFIRDEEKVSEFDLIRDMISDQSLYSYIKNRFTDEQKAPQFAYCLTIQNHGGYEKGTIEYNVNITEGIENKHAYREYLTLLTHSDNALRDIITYFENYNYPTVICVVGDHAPMFSYDIQNINCIDDSLKHYGTPFIIWANYDIEDKDVGYVSMNYLGGMIAETAGIPLTPYETFLKNIRATLPVISTGFYYGEDGIGRTYEEESIYSELLNKYFNLEYANVSKDADKYKHIFHIENLAYDE